MTCGIYSCQNTITGDRYIGSSVHVEERRNQHCRCLNNDTYRSPSGRRTHWQNAWNLYGPDVFKWEVLRVLPDGAATDERVAIEQEYLDRYLPEYNTNKIAGVPPSHAGKTYEEEYGIARATERRERLSRQNIDIGRRPPRHDELPVDVQKTRIQKISQSNIKQGKRPPSFREYTSEQQEAHRERARRQARESKGKSYVAKYGAEQASEIQAKLSLANRGKALTPARIEQNRQGKLRIAYECACGESYSVARLGRFKGLRQGCKCGNVLPSKERP
jgi:group I intron endonuclease